MIFIQDAAGVLQVTVPALLPSPDALVGDLFDPHVLLCGGGGGLSRAALRSVETRAGVAAFRRFVLSFGEAWDARISGEKLSAPTACTDR